jgi:hypothetical protein
MTLHTSKALPKVGLVVAISIAPALVCQFAEPIHALTLSLGGTQVAGEGTISSVSTATTIRFNDLPLDTTIDGFTSGIARYSAPNPPGQASVVSGTVVGRHFAPSDDNSPYLTIGAAQEPGPLTINFSRPLDYFGLYWGSIDSSNSIEFYNNDVLVESFSGLNVYNLDSSIVDGAGGVPGSRFVNFTATRSDEVFNRIVLRFSQPAFETDNHAYRAAFDNPPSPLPQVPTPALLPGLLGLAWTVLRKHRQ